MKQEKEVRISYWATHFTTVVSVTMVLILAGIITIVSISARNETSRLRERLEVTVVMADSVSNKAAEGLADEIAEMPYAKDVRMVSKEEALKEWKEDTGEDLEALFGINPLSPEISFNIRAPYSSDATLRKIETNLSSLPGVEGVAMPDSKMVENMNHNIEAIAVVLGVIAVAMVVISFVLINNTVHLAVYARRFTIHTMQLVGATNGFIRRPFVLGNMFAGLVAGLLASGLLALIIILAPEAGFNGMSDYVSWGLYACVAGGMLVVGTLLCGFAAGVATTRYLRKDYEDLFR